MSRIEIGIESYKQQINDRKTTKPIGCKFSRQDEKIFRGFQREFAGLIVVHYASDREIGLQVQSSVPPLARSYTIVSAGDEALSITA